MRLLNRCTVVPVALLLLTVPCRAQAGEMPADPRGPVAKMEEATSRLQAGAYLEAAELFALAGDAQHDWPFADDAALCRIQALEAAGQDDDARDLWRSWFADHPGSPLRLEARLACAWNHLRGDDSAGAERLVQDAIAAEPWAAQDPQVRLVQAACALVADRSETTLDHLAIARRGGPTDLGLMLEGIANERLHREQAAAVVYQELIDERPDSPLAGYALMAKGRIFASAASYRAAAERFGRTAGATTRADLRGEVEYLAAACRFLGGEQEAGLAAMEAVATRNAGHELAARSLFSLGEMLWIEQRYEPAITRFNEVLSGYFVDDLAGRALYRIGRCLDALGRTVEANTTYQAVADGYPLAPEAPAAVYLTGVGLLEQERYLAAAPYFQLLLDRYAGDGAAFVFASAERQELVEAGLCLLEYSYYRAGETGLMAGAPHLALQAMPKSDSIWRAYALLLDADALATVDRYAEAQTTLTGLLAACPDHAVAIRANRLLAWTYASQSREDLAIATEQAMLARYSAQDDEANLSAALLTIAHSHFNAKRYAEAAEQYRQYVQRFAGQGHKLSALYQEGLCYARLGRSGDAVDAWRLVTDEAPTSPEARQAWLRAGDALFQAGHFGEARECYNALRQNFADPPAQAAATLRLARCDYNEDQGTAALARFREVTTAYPTSPEAAEATEGITQILYNLGREGDLSALQDLVQSYPDSPLAPEAGFELALVAYEAGDYAGAAAQYDALCARYPRYSAADRHLYYATDSHAKAGDTAAARDGWTAFLRRFPGSELAPAALFNLARSRFDEGQYTAAAADFGRVLDRPADPAIHAAARLNLAMSQRILGQTDLALATLHQCLLEQPSDDPQRVAAARLLGEIHQEVGHPREAARYYQEAVAAGADPAAAVELNYLAGLCLKEAGDVTGALAAFNQAIQSPDKADYYRLSALAQAADLDEQSGNVKAALHTYRDLIENATDPALAAAASDRVTQLEADLAP